MTENIMNKSTDEGLGCFLIAARPERLARLGLMAAAM
jgi:hypothetical protein